MYTLKKNSPPTYRLHIQKDDQYHLWWENNRGHRIPVKSEETFHKSSKIIFAEKEYDNFTDLAGIWDKDETTENTLELKDKYGRYMLMFAERLYTGPVYVFMDAPVYAIFIVCAENGKIHILETTENAYNCTVTEDAEVLPPCLYKRIASKKYARHLFSDEYEVIRETVLF